MDVYRLGRMHLISDFISHTLISFTLNILLSLVPVIFLNEYVHT